MKKNISLVLGLVVFAAPAAFAGGGMSNPDMYDMYKRAENGTSSAAMPMAAREDAPVQPVMMPTNQGLMMFKGGGNKRVETDTDNHGVVTYENMTETPMVEEATTVDVDIDMPMVETPGIFNLGTSSGLRNRYAVQPGSFRSLSTNSASTSKASKLLQYYGNWGGANN